MTLKQVQNALDDWERRRRAESLALAQLWAGKIEGDMRINAPWTDRTSLARNGLFAVASMSQDDISIHLCHTMDYGIHLEKANDGRYAILKPTRNKFAQDVRKSFRDLWE